MRLQTIVKLSSFVLLLIAVSIFCERKTHGFRLYHLLSDLPNDARWHSFLPQEEKMVIDRLTDQSFTFLGKGGFCCAFLGADGKTVLKFYTHHHLSLLGILRCFTWEKLLLKTSVLRPHLLPHQEFTFKSCKLLFDNAKDITGLLFMHLNKTEDVRTVTLFDGIGMAHTIDLNQTEFVLQQRAESLIAYIDRCVKEHKGEQVKRAIDSYLNCLLTLCKRGMRDIDRSFKNNYGILESGVVIAMDISSFVEDPSLKRPGMYKQEIVLKSQNLARWLRKNHLDLLHYYEEKIADLIENQ